MGAKAKKTHWMQCPHYGQARARIVNGSYNGDGNATKAISGLGITPKFLQIQSFISGNNEIWWKNDSMPGNQSIQPVINGTMQDDMIISLDADGFTVGDGTGYGNYLNINGRPYYYTAIGEEVT